jgi:predicted phosphodiesterase
MIQLFQRSVLRLANKYASQPDRERIYASLSDLLTKILAGDTNRGLVVPFDINTGKFIIFSDQHKGKRNGADDFMICEPNYLKALDYYYQNGFHLVTLGDSEELWENTLSSVKTAQAPSFEKEKQFLPKNAFIKIFGNHDLFWDNDPFAPLQLKDIYGVELPIHEGVVLQTTISNQVINIFCTHGHQGDKVSDGNWFSKFFVSRIWAPLQSYLRINPNTPAYDATLKTAHNTLMYEWSSQQKDLFFITGHTHQPVFESLTHIERLYRQLLFARQVQDDGMCHALQKEIRLRKFEYDVISDDYMKLKPTYFNTGCCCFSDGDITGIEIEQNCFRLIKWTSNNGPSRRVILEESTLEELLEIMRRE